MHDGETSRWIVGGSRSRCNLEWEVLVAIRSEETDVAGKEARDHQHHGVGDRGFMLIENVA